MYHNLVVACSKYSNNMNACSLIQIVNDQTNTRIATRRQLRKIAKEVLVYVCLFLLRVLFQVTLFISQLTDTSVGFTMAGMIMLTKEVLLTVRFELIRFSFS